MLAYSVGQRRHEIGVRMALGAREAQVTRMVLKQGLSLAIVGLVIGTVWVLPLTMIASVVPARRAASVDPVDALRAE